VRGQRSFSLADLAGFDIPEEETVQKEKFWEMK
jgi:hypothetical protein